MQEIAVIKIAIVNAFPVGLNPGMLSVDFAFDSFIKKYEVDANIDYLSSDMNYSLRHSENEITWARFKDVKQIYGYDKIIYWGDFLQWVGFGENDWCDRQPHEPKDKLMQEYYRLFLLDKDEELHKKTILFGGTIYPLSSNDLLNTHYYNCLKQLITHAQLALFRDVISAGFAQQLSNNETQFWGCDCAFLLDTGNKTPKLKNYLMYSFGRSGQEHAQVEFAHQLAKKLHLEPMDIKWLDLKIPLAKKIQLIKQASVVLTDIYHLSITGLREQIPTLCVGQGNSYAVLSLSDKKKEILFKQHFAENYYIFLDEIISSSNNTEERMKMIDRCSELLMNTDQLAIISNMLSKQIERASSKLCKALSRA